jgi:hypothetical protein
MKVDEVSITEAATPPIAKAVIKPKAKITVKAKK